MHHAIGIDPFVDDCRSQKERRREDRDQAEGKP
jgi:hypothetical protein